MQSMTFEVSYCEASPLPYRICPLTDGVYQRVICFGDSLQTMNFICSQLNRFVLTQISDDPSVSLETICGLMGIPVVGF